MCGLEFAQPRALLSTCVLWCCTQFVFLSAACFHVVMSCVSCPVLHMAAELFCWPCACVFVLCEHMAFVLVFCVLCALVSIVLAPPILFPDYWLICPTFFYSLPSSFAPFIISLCLQSCASSSLMLPWWYLALSCLAKPGCQLSCFSSTG